jgi:hypothetical protein
MNLTEDQIAETAKMMKKRDDLKLATGLAIGVTIVLSLISTINTYKSGEIDELYILAAAMLGAAIYGYMRYNKLDKEVRKILKKLENH